MVDLLNFYVCSLFFWSRDFYKVGHVIKFAFNIPNLNTHISFDLNTFEAISKIWALKKYWTDSFGGNKLILWPLIQHFLWKENHSANRRQKVCVFWIHLISAFTYIILSPWKNMTVASLHLYSTIYLIITVPVADLLKPELPDIHYFIFYILSTVVSFL